MAEISQEVRQTAEDAMGNDRKLEDLVDALHASSRRARQSAASSLAYVAHLHPDLMSPYSAQIVDALNCTEAQTRWECLDILTLMVPKDARLCEKALPGAETALFDEESGFVRLASMRFLCAYAATTENRSERCWPLIEEAIQCYHGDVEFNDMLNAVEGFAAGKLSEHVRESLIERMSFDAHNGKGALKRKAQAIIDAAQRS